jgi:hypothetical protein
MRGRRRGHRGNGCPAGNLLSGSQKGGCMYERIESWRAQNARQILDKARRRAGQGLDIDLERAHPRLMYILLDLGSWHDRDSVQEMWAGLLASSCAGDVRDESNLIFINLLGAMTLNEIAMFNHACNVANKIVSPEGLIIADQLLCELYPLGIIAGITELSSLDRELDHMRMLGLFPYGMDSVQDVLVADITPSTLALHMYARCQGHPGSPADYFLSL